MAPLDDCANCGSGIITLTVEWSEPVVLDGDSLVSGDVVEGHCQRCGAPYPVDDIEWIMQRREP
jgi:hypothetical protein